MSGGDMDNVEVRHAERRRVQELVIVTLAASVLDVLVTFWALSHRLEEPSGGTAWLPRR